jgi:hypothetical protein
MKRVPVEWIYIGEGEWLLVEQTREGAIRARIQRHGWEPSEWEPIVTGYTVKKTQPLPRVATLPDAVAAIRAVLGGDIPEAE